MTRAPKRQIGFLIESVIQRGRNVDVLIALIRRFHFIVNQGESC